MAIGQVLMYPVKFVTGLASFGGAVFGVIREETPAYDVLKRVAAEGSGLAFEVRRYAAFQTIETDMDDGDNGFMRLAGYIGVIGDAQNDAGEKISMTTPVLSNLRPDDAAKPETRMAFSLPSSVTKAPRPNDSRIKTATRPPSTWAVHRFRGSWDREHAMAAAEKLRAQLRSKEMAMDEGADYEWLRYNPPFTLPFLRTNEIAIKLADDAVPAPPAAEANQA
uniref:SOUL heme-binding protein n=1 Tax=Phaeomonas parva TaxID=124430 RepID=A0A7S1U316_9STRA